MKYLSCAINMLVTVLYRECGGLECDRDQTSGFSTALGSASAGKDFTNSADKHYNAFEFNQPAGERCVTVGDLVRAFPLGPEYHFDVLRHDGIFESVHQLDLSSPVPITDGVITCNVFRLACQPQYASGGRGRMIDISEIFDARGGSQQRQYDRRPSGNSGGSSVNVMKDLTKNAGKATKGFIGFVGHAMQRTAEYLTHQEIVVGVYKVQLVREMAEGGESPWDIEG